MTPRPLRTRALWLAACLLAVPPASAQTAPTLEAARQHARDGEWARAAEVTAALVERDATDRPARLLLGASLAQLERYAEAADVYEEAAAAGAAPPLVLYLAGLRNAQAGDADAAFDWLGRAVDAGYGNLRQLQADPALAAFRGDPRYLPLQERADRNARPCAYSEDHRAFDFWVGEWDVADPAGQPVGTNSVRLAEGECALIERWSGAAGGTGTSLNYYDPAKDRWVQHWVAPGGTLIAIEGGLDAAGAMVLTGTITTASGDVAPFRGTWTPLPDGRVRQAFERSPDDGATWAPWFTGVYVRREAPTDEG